MNKRQTDDLGGVARISVIVPAYNCADTILDTISSVQRADQNDAVGELIIVDDGSSDGTESLVRSAAQSYDKLRLICQDNGGVAKARNAGIAAATCEFIFFVDGDDRLAKDAFDRLLRYSDADIIRARHYLWNSVSGAFAANAGEQNSLPELNRAPPASVGRLSTCYSCWNTLFRRDMILAHELGFKVGLPLGEDRVFMLNAISAAQSITVIPFYTYFWRRDERNKKQATQTLTKSAKNVITSIEEYLFAAAGSELFKNEFNRIYIQTTVWVELMNFVSQLSGDILKDDPDADLLASFSGALGLFNASDIDLNLTGVKGWSTTLAPLYASGLDALRVGAEDIEPVREACRKALSKIRLKLKLESQPAAASDSASTGGPAKEALVALVRAAQVHRSQNVIAAEVNMIKRTSRFDASYYGARNPDVLRVGLDPVEHYVMSGAAECRDPSPAFSTIEYYRKHPEVAFSGRNPLVHALTSSAR